MVAGGVNQRCSIQNTPPSAGLTAMLSVFLAPALKCAKLLPVPRRNSPNCPTNKQFVRPIMKSSGSFSWFCSQGLKSPAGRRGQACAGGGPGLFPTNKTKKKVSCSHSCFMHKLNLRCCADQACCTNVCGPCGSCCCS